MCVNTEGVNDDLMAVASVRCGVAVTGTHLAPSLPRTADDAHLY